MFLSQLIYLILIKKADSFIRGSVKRNPVYCAPALQMFVYCFTFLLSGKISLLMSKMHQLVINDLRYSQTLRTNHGPTRDFNNVFKKLAYRRLCTSWYVRRPSCFWSNNALRLFVGRNVDPYAGYIGGDSSTRRLQVRTSPDVFALPRPQSSFSTCKCLQVGESACPANMSETKTCQSGNPPTDFKSPPLTDSTSHVILRPASHIPSQFYDQRPISLNTPQ